ncbi:MAG: M20/M25/M40 family metallo-hydrolase, partial [Chloroflexi bacterium]|nr:M20/M25/M40 family metallo-hydrolase [Chloroflexota bacterium]
ATFARLVGIDSPSGGEGALARIIGLELERLGWTVADDRSGPDCGNVIASLPGESGLEPLMFTSHMDVVAPCHGIQARLHDGVFVTAGDTVLGADAKASVAALIEMAQMLAHSPSASRPPLELVFTWGEEVGHLGAKAVDLAHIQSARAYVLDGLMPVGTIVTAAPTYYSFSVRLAGRAAHAGVEPERGISAIALAAQAIMRLPWGRLDESTTANIGTIHGGSARNAVAAETLLDGEVRSLEPERAAAIVRAIERVFTSVATEAGAAAEVRVEEVYRGYALDPELPLIALARRAFASLGTDRVGELVRTGGGSDANEFNTRGLVACVLGIGAENCHSVQERMRLSELVLLTEWVIEIVRHSAQPR